MDYSLYAFRTELGWMALLEGPEAVAGLTFGYASKEAAVAPLRRSFGAALPGLGQSEVVERLQAFAEGEPDDFLDVSLALDHLTPFQTRIVAHCRRIGWGSTLSYAELAAKAGSSGAARAVGSTMATNRFPLIVPCHRVIASGGRLGGYSSPEGLMMKRRLLEREGAYPLVRPPPPVTAAR